jgi:hypothetical protein
MAMAGFLDQGSSRTSDAHIRAIGHSYLTVPKAGAASEYVTALAPARTQ